VVSVSVLADSTCQNLGGCDPDTPVGWVIFWGGIVLFVIVWMRGGRWRELGRVVSENRVLRAVRRLIRGRPVSSVAVVVSIVVGAAIAPAAAKLLAVLLLIGLVLAAGGFLAWRFAVLWVRMFRNSREPRKRPH
jgi:hypothetical protein